MTGPPHLALQPCPPGLRHWAAATLGADGPDPTGEPPADPSAPRPGAVGAAAGRTPVAGAPTGPLDLADLLPPGLAPGRTWPTVDDVLGMAVGGHLVVRGQFVIGGCGPVGPPDAAGCQEISFRLAPAYRGRGLGAASVRLLVAALRTEPGVRTLCARVLPANAPSVRLLSALGFRPDPVGADAPYQVYRLD